MQRTLPASGLHLALVMDGNGRWAERRGLPRAAGHRAGAEALRRVVEAAPGLGVGTLTVYAFSADNWRRPPREVSALMSLLGATLRAEAPKLRRAGVRLQLIGRRDRLPLALRSAAARAEWDTRRGTRLTLRVAVDYSARAAICAAAGRLAGTDGPPTRDAFEAALGAALHPDGGASPAVDLLVRAGGERRLSDFLLWEAAYAELRFDDTLWPDVDGDWLADAVADFDSRQRRFGGLVAA
ncbi:polyprenyl diphosphate synthase [Rubrivirga sp. IMCC43871]|uniref:polyprenyl diphosphate synthase n=1 Tax=Rubrivirga sp. IMCC43871 TaxID=3391575 RepID=UPI0039901A9D